MTTAAYLAFEPSDQAPADACAAELERNGWTVTRSTAELRAQEHLPTLVQTIGESGVLVVLTSPAAEASPSLRREMAAALNNGRAIIPVRIADLPAGSWLDATLDAVPSVDMRNGAGAESLARLVELSRAGPGRGRVIAMLNIKGGVGKTVLAANLFAAAHLADHRAVSFIDLDPQHNLTQYFLPPAERYRIRGEGRTIYAALTARGEASAARDSFEKLATPLNRAGRSGAPRFDLVAGDERLFEFTLDARSERDRAEAFNRFRALVALLRARSDVVVIDSNPCATFLTRLAITAADHIIAPVRPEKYSLTGLNMLEHVVREIRGRPLRSSEFSVLLNGVNDRTRSQDGDADALTRAEIEAAPFFGQALLDETVPYSGALRAVPSERFAINPINTTAMMRMGARGVKEALAQAAAAILKRAMS